MKTMKEDLEQDVAMTPEDIEAEFDHGFVIVNGGEGTLEAVDVADYILGRLTIDRLGLQQFLHLSQALRLALTGRPILGDAIEAWQGGPVVPSVDGLTHGTERMGDGSLLNEHERSIVSMVLVMDRHALASWTHSREPWRMARVRAGVSSDEDSTEVVRLEDVMAAAVRGLELAGTSGI